MASDHTNYDYPWISYEEFSIPTSLADNDNFYRFKYSIYWYNFVTLLMIIVPLTGTLTTTILGAMAITSSDYIKIVMSQTIISAITCFLTGISAYFRKFGLDTLKTLAPDLKQYIKAWIAGVPIVDYNFPQQIQIPIPPPVTIGINPEAKVPAEAGQASSQSALAQPEISNLSPIISFLVENALLERGIRESSHIPIPALALNPPLVSSPITIVINPAENISPNLSPVLSFFIDDKKSLFSSSTTGLIQYSSSFRGSIASATP